MDGTKSALQDHRLPPDCATTPQCAFGNLDDLAGEYAFRIGAIPAPNIHGLVAHLRKSRDWECSDST